MSSAVLKMTAVPVTSFYGWRVLKVSGARNHHDGCDTANGSKYPVSAFGAGVVVESPQKSKHWKYGWYIRIKHADGIETSHHSLDKAALFKVGQTVELGDIIGHAGSSALAASGNHVHNALWLNGRHVDPLKYLKPGVAVTVTNTGSTAVNTSTPLENDVVTQDEMQQIANAVLNTGIDTPVGHKPLKQAISDAILFGKAAEEALKGIPERLSAVPGAVWSHGLEHPLAGRPVSAGDLLRYEPAEHENTRRAVAAIVSQGSGVEINYDELVTKLKDAGFDIGAIAKAVNDEAAERLAS